MEQLHHYWPVFYNNDVLRTIEEVKRNNSIIYGKMHCGMFLFDFFIAKMQHGISPVTFDAKMHCRVFISDLLGQKYIWNNSINICLTFTTVMFTVQ